MLKAKLTQKYHTPRLTFKMATLMTPSSPSKYRASTVLPGTGPAMGPAAMCIDSLPPLRSAPLRTRGKPRHGWNCMCSTGFSAMGRSYPMTKTRPEPEPRLTCNSDVSKLASEVWLSARSMTMLIRHCSAQCTSRMTGCMAWHQRETSRGVIQSQTE